MRQPSQAQPLRLGVPRGFLSIDDLLGGPRRRVAFLLARCRIWLESAGWNRVSHRILLHNEKGRARTRPSPKRLDGQCQYIRGQRPEAPDPEGLPPQGGTDVCRKSGGTVGRYMVPECVGYKAVAGRIGVQIGCMGGSMLNIRGQDAKRRGKGVVSPGRIRRVGGRATCVVRCQARTGICKLPGRLVNQFYQ